LWDSIIIVFRLKGSALSDRSTALDLPMVDPLPAPTQKYFDICTEKLGMIPNVLQPLDARQSQMLTFAEKMTVASAAIVEDDRNALRGVGFSDRDIWDIAAVAGFYNMSNRIASATDMRPNDEYHAQAR